MVALDATRDTLEARLRNRGFAHAEVMRNYSISSAAPYEAQVTFGVYPGVLTRFGQLTVVVRGTDGREPTMDEGVVRRMLPFREGDEYQEDLQFAGQRSLYNLEIFRGVSFLPDSISSLDSILPFTIEVDEGEVHRVRAGWGLSTAECFNAEARWSNLNFIGGARRLQVSGRVSNLGANSLQNTPFCRQAGKGVYGELTGLISVNFVQPWFFSPRNAVSASLFMEKQSVDGVFVREALGMSLGFSRTLTRSVLLGISLRPQSSRLKAAEVIFCSAYLICEKDEIALFQDTDRILSPVGISLSQDRRNQALSPTRGYSVGVDLEHAGDWTGSDFRYTRVVSEATWHTEVQSQWVVGARLRGGRVIPGAFLGLGQDGSSNEIVHPEKRLFAGGSSSVRGFGQNRLGPRTLYIGNVKDLIWKPGTVEPGVCSPEEVMDQSCDASDLKSEYFLVQPKGGTKLIDGSLELRFRIAGRLWEGATFLDFGQVWDEATGVSLGGLEFTPGFGVRYFSPIGPVRVDLAYRFGGGEPLPVVTQAIVPYDPTVHDPDQQLTGPNGEKFPYALPGDLVVLDTSVLWREGLGPFDLRRFQLHFSIGQAF
jgi:outer membrane protein insertion porin family/translocation and assembly module TamA